MSTEQESAVEPRRIEDLLNGDDVNAAVELPGKPALGAWRAVAVGFVLSIGGLRIYHAGDTDHIPEMAQVTGVDVALLPVSGKYVMTAVEAVEAAHTLQPALAVRWMPRAVLMLPSMSMLAPLLLAIAVTR